MTALEVPPDGPAEDITPAVTPAISLDGVQVRYRDRVALDGVDLAIDEGELVALVGPNGAGKSTLLRVIAGTLAPTVGRVRLFGLDAGSADRAAVARRLAVVPQAAAIPFATRVEEVVGLGRIPHEDPFRGPGPADLLAIEAAIERVGIADLVGRDARELSLGERQLVMIAMAVAQGTPVILLDEPTVHLDLRHQVAAMELLGDLHRRDGRTVVAVLHDLSMAAHFFARIVLLDAGRIVVDGAPRDVLSPERVRDVFGVGPGLVRLPGEGAEHGARATLRR